MLSKEDIDKIIEPYEETYKFSLYARSGNPSNGYDSYNYLSIDDLGINININPNDKYF